MAQWVKCLPLTHGKLSSDLQYPKLRSQTWSCTPVTVTLAGGRRCRNSRTPKDTWPESPANQLVPGPLRDLFSKDKEETNSREYLTLTSVYVYICVYMCVHIHTKNTGNFFFKKFDHGN